MMRYYSGYGMGPFGGGHGVIGILVMLFFLALVVFAVLIAIRMLRHKGHFAPPHFHEGQVDPSARNALQILNERYAKGEIDDEEYKRRKTELTKP